MSDAKLKHLYDVIEKSNRIVFFGGAGTSTESNVPDFRSKDGLYSQDFHGYNPEQVLSHDFFFDHTALFYDYTRTHLMKADIKPHFGHYALVDLEKRGKLKAIVTQNIDALHQMAGSQNVLELHGSLARYTCTSCGREYDLDMLNFNEKDGIPRCSHCRGLMKPNVVLYGESLDGNVINDTIRAISSADCLIVCGSSLIVYPAASFIDFFKGDNLVLINKESTPYDIKANLVIHEGFGETFKKLSQYRQNKL